MRPFTRLDGMACPLPIAAVDTDQLIPARFMQRTRAQGYGPVLLHDLRFAADGTPHPDFPLNQRPGAEILVARRNFGSGSSREAAVYALVDHGITCVIAPSFGDIFAANSVNNGLLPARVSEAEAEALLAALQAGRTTLAVDLAAQTIQAGNLRVDFSIDPVWRTKLLNGWDDLDLTLSHRSAIQDFAARDALSRPWARP
jgi:3-isopropylmalate/(R)-2-methylmalate dehydratase small subunit